MMHLKAKHDDMCGCSNVGNDDWYTIEPIEKVFFNDAFLVVYRNGQSLAENEIPPCLLAQYKDCYPGREIIKITEVVDKHGNVTRIA